MAVASVEPPKDKKFRKSIGVNIDFADLGNEIFRATIEIKTFDLKDELKEKGFTFDGKNTDQVRDGKVQKNFVQKKEIYLMKDIAGLKKVALTEVLEILRSFEKSIVLDSKASANDGTTKQNAQT